MLWTAASRWAAVAVDGSRFETPNRPDAQAAGVAITQHLSDNSQTVTWLHQFGDAAALDVVAYRRSASAALDAVTGVPLAATPDRSLDHQGANASILVIPTCCSSILGVAARRSFDGSRCGSSWRGVSCFCCWCLT